MPDILPLDVLAFSRAYHVVRNVTRQALDRHGLNLTAWFILRIVASYPAGVQLRDIADQIGLKPPLVTMIAARLTTRGLVEQRVNPIDKRSKLVQLTPVGKNLLRSAGRSVNARIRRLLPATDRDDLAAYRRVIAALLAADAPD